MSDINLPPLPHAAWNARGPVSVVGPPASMYTQQQMEDYARAAVLADRATRAPQQAEPWIACSERMPEQGLAVLIIDIDGDHDIGRWNGNEWFTFSRNAYSSWEVKHWMPLPAAPGKGGA